MSQQIGDKNTQNTYWQIGIGLVVTVVAIVLMLLVARSLARPILAAVGMAKTIAQGQFDKRLE